MSCLRNHGFRYLDPHDFLKALGKRNRQPTDSRSKIQRGFVIKLTEMPGRYCHHAGNEFSTALEELFAVGFDIFFTKPFLGECGEVRILLSPPLPMVIRVVHQVTLSSSRRRNCIRSRTVPTSKAKRTPTASNSSGTLLLLPNVRAALYFANVASGFCRLFRQTCRAPSQLKPYSM